jgi:hypothetical protein
LPQISRGARGISGFLVGGYEEDSVNQAKIGTRIKEKSGEEG